MAVFLIISTVLVIIGRALVPGHGLTLAGSYEAFAHIWVGFLLALAVSGPEMFLSIWCLCIATGFEVVAFMMRRKTP